MLPVLVWTFSLMVCLVPLRFGGLFGLVFYGHACNLTASRSCNVTQHVECTNTQNATTAHGTETCGQNSYLSVYYYQGT